MKTLSTNKLSDIKGGNLCSQIRNGHKLEELYRLKYGYNIRFYYPDVFCPPLVEY